MDSEGLGHEVLAAEFNAIDISITQHELHRRFRGWGLSELIEVVEAEYARPVDEDFVERFRAHQRAVFRERLQPMPGADRALADVSRRGIRQCVASGGPQSKLSVALATTGLRSWFEERVFSSYDIDSWKPDPGLFLHVARHFDVKPQQCLVVEDSEVGMIAAQRAGMPTVIVGDAVQDTSGAHRISGLADFPALLDRLGA